MRLRFFYCRLIRFSRAFLVSAATHGSRQRDAQAVVDVRNEKTTGERECTVCVMVLTPAFANALLCADRHLYETLVRVTVYSFAPNLLAPNKKVGLRFFDSCDEGVHVPNQNNSLDCVSKDKNFRPFTKRKLTIFDSHATQLIGKQAVNRTLRGLAHGRMVALRITSTSIRPCCALSRLCSRAASCLSRITSNRTGVICGRDIGCRAFSCGTPQCRPGFEVSLF
jgi:hypothetical protein